MDFWKMQYFIQICNEESISRAAKSLYISQQGLSKTIKSMEEEFQVTLLERTAKGVKPTKYGEILYDKCKKILKEYDEMVETLTQSIQMDKKKISIGIADILYTDSLKKVLLDFQEEYSDIILEFVEMGFYACTRYLKEELVDICFTISPTEKKGYRYIPFYDIKMVLMISNRNPLTKKEHIYMADLKNEKFIMLTEEYKIRSIVMSYCATAGFEPKIAITTSQLVFIKELIELNKGIAILPDINYFRNNKNLTVTEIDDLPCTIEIGVVLNKNKKLNSLTSELIQLLYYTFGTSEIS